MINQHITIACVLSVFVQIQQVLKGYSGTLYTWQNSSWSGQLRSEIWLWQLWCDLTPTDSTDATLQKWLHL